MVTKKGGGKKGKTGTKGARKPVKGKTGTKGARKSAATGKTPSKGGRKR